MFVEGGACATAQWHNGQSKPVSESRMTWATSVPMLVFLGLDLCSRLRPDVRDRQTDVRQPNVRRASSLNAPSLGAGYNNAKSGSSEHDKTQSKET